MQVVERHKVQTQAMISRKCGECGRTRVRYITMQTRGADEGSTVHYTCDCGHRYECQLLAQAHIPLTLWQLDRKQLELRRGNDDVLAVWQGCQLQVVAEKQKSVVL